MGVPGDWYNSPDLLASTVAACQGGVPPWILWKPRDLVNADCPADLASASQVWPCKIVDMLHAKRNVPTYVALVSTGDTCTAPMIWISTPDRSLGRHRLGAFKAVCHADTSTSTECPSVIVLVLRDLVALILERPRQAKHVAMPAKLVFPDRARLGGHLGGQVQET